MKLPQYLINDIKCILDANGYVEGDADDGFNLTDYGFETRIVLPIYQQVFRHFAGQVLKKDDLSMSEVLDLLSGVDRVETE